MKLVMRDKSDGSPSVAEGIARWHAVKSDYVSRSAVSS